MDTTVPILDMDEVVVEQHGDAVRFGNIPEIIAAAVHYPSGYPNIANVMNVVIPKEAIKYLHMPRESNFGDKTACF